MKAINSIANKILNREELIKKVAQWRLLNKKVAFTNGCFDILHEGHIASLMEAARLADYLVVGMNADASVRKLKGDGRPVNSEQARALVLASLAVTDAVVIFEEDTPRELIVSFLPDFLVKGGDYKIDDIAGAKEVVAAGGQVVLNPIIPNISTTRLVEKLQHKR